MSPRRFAAMTLILLLWQRRFYYCGADFAAVSHQTYCDTANLLLRRRLYRSFVPIALQWSQLCYRDSADLAASIVSILLLRC